MKNVAHRLPSTATLVACLLLGGCSLLAPQRDPSRFFTLSPMAPADAPPAVSADPSRVTCGLGPVTLPMYLDRNEVATRVSPTEIVYSPIDRWAESLSIQVARTLLQNLSALLGPDRVVPWPGTLPVDRQIEVTVLRFERVATEATQLTARWSVKDLRSGRLIVLKESSYTHAPESTAAAGTVSALSADLADLSRDIAHEVQGP